VAPPRAVGKAEEGGAIERVEKEEPNDEQPGNRGGAQSGGINGEHSQGRKRSRSCTTRHRHVRV
jgi:hypothetical protein